MLKPSPRPIVVGISGKKFAGKSTLTRFLRENAHQLWPGLHFCVLPMAGELKRVCVDLLGLNPEHVYGSDADKENLTEYRWEDLPHYDRLRRKYIDDRVAQLPPERLHLGRIPWGHDVEPIRKEFEAVHSGRMTVRQVMQELGTGIFRQLHPDIHTRAWARKVRKGEFDVFVCDDFRFENEAEAIKSLGGFLVRLTGGAGGDGHVSETALRDDSPCFDAVIPGNGHAPFSDSAKALVLALRDFGLVGGREAEEVFQTIGEGVL